MDAQISWEADPVVRLERALTPIIPRILFHYMEAAEEIDELKTFIFNAAHEIQDVQTGPMDAAEIFLEDADRKFATEMSKGLRNLAEILPEKFVDHKDKGAFFAELQATYYPRINQLLDVFRRTFISTILERHVQSDQRAMMARDQLRKISKQIFYVSLNASVEASRAGENGAAFNVISQEIRQLAKQAELSVSEI